MKKIAELGMKRFAMIGMLVGILVVLFGLLFVCGVFGAKVEAASLYAGYDYDYGYAKFGADFYTYVSNNAYAAALASKTVSQNQVAISNLMETFFGIFLIAVGTSMFCLFGFKLSKLNEEEAVEIAARIKAEKEEKEEAPVAGEDLPNLE